VTACLPDKPTPERPVGETSADTISRGLFAQNGGETATRNPMAGRWRTIHWLESKGLLPNFVEQLEQKVRLLHGELAPATPEKEWAAVTDLIVCHWRQARKTTAGTGRPHVFIGPPGAGKTTALCKWMVSSVLVNEHSVRVWRLDGPTANAAEILLLHCESLGVPTARFWQEPAPEADLLFVDLPGVEIHNTAALADLQEQLAQLPQPHIHLVLNAASESAILFEQFHVFESFKPEDIIFTHLDEEQQRVKLWNFVLGTNCPISYLAFLFPQKNRR
jgi:hypothetical protein